ncbi:MAG: hypothetical protein A2V66_04615 [Ignavibacteria bacterium RBG_13_36_8]|nr:MAG: hypothetical protein A2V66_04615 [Ignavibacteria bacterium RBG_13_36_8]
MKNSFFSDLFSSENKFFKLAQNAKRLPHILISSIFPIFFIFIGSLVYYLLIILAKASGEVVFSPLIKDLVELTFLFAFIILAVYLWVKLVERRPFYTIGLTKEKALKRYLFGFGTGILMISAVVGLMAVFGNAQIEQSKNTITGIPAIGWVLLILFGFIIQGGAEEITTRGWQFQVIGVKYKPWIGALISSVFFAVLHGFNNSVTVLAIFNLFLFALLLVFYVINDGSIWSACGWHSAWNWAMGNLYGLEVSGTNVNASIFNFKITGHDIITGGGFGPEGSIFTTLVLSTGILMIVTYIYRKNN